jgi:excinuclease UvrABC ATPase subunit
VTSQDYDLFKGDINDITMISRNFNRLLRNTEGRRNPQAMGNRPRFQNPQINRGQRFEQNTQQDNSWQQTEQRAPQNFRGQNDNSRTLKCIECEGVGHVQAQCTNLMMTQQNKSLVTSWSEDDEDDRDKDFTSNYTAFGARFHQTDGSMSSYNPGSLVVSGYNPGSLVDDDVENGDSRMSYEDVYDKWLKAEACIESLRSENAALAQRENALSQSLVVLQQEKNALIVSLDKMTTRAEDSENAINRRLSSRHICFH